MEFDKKEIAVIYAMLTVSIQSICNKRHKSAKDMEAIHELRRVKKKIDNYLEGEKKNEVSK